MSSVRSKQGAAGNLDLRATVSPQNPLQWLLYLTIPAVYSEMVSAVPSAWKVAVRIGGLAAIALVLWGYQRQKRRLEELREFRVERVPPQPARGLILMIGPYNPFRDDLKDPAVLNPRLAHLRSADPLSLTRADFEAVNLYCSNLRPAIEAVAYHRQPAGSQGLPVLAEVWLLHTRSEVVTKADGTVQSFPGGEVAAEILEKFLRREHARDLVIHREGLAVRAWDWAALTRKAEQIFREAAYKPEHLVADVTGGTAMMSVALATACIQPGRRMQYMDSQRDWKGQPVGPGAPTPVMIDIDPILYTEAEPS